MTTNQHTNRERMKIELGYNDYQMDLRIIAKRAGFPGNIPVMPGNPDRGEGIYFLCITYAKTEYDTVMASAEQVKTALIDHPVFEWLEQKDHGSQRSRNHSSLTIKVQVKELAHGTDDSPRHL